MKTISLRQPWAYLLCAGIKDIENRTWNLPRKYLGERVLIHASADKKLNLLALTGEQYEDACNKSGWKETRSVDRWDRSAIIGSVRFVDCVVNHPSIWAEKSTPIELDEFGFPIKYDKKIYNWVVADPILFDKPILNVKGKLRFWSYGINNVGLRIKTMI